MLTATWTSKKQISKRTTLRVQRTFLYFSLPSLHDRKVVLPKFLFYRECEQTTTNFSFAFWNGKFVLGSQLPTFNLKWASRDNRTEVSQNVKKSLFKWRSRRLRPRGILGYFRTNPDIFETAYVFTRIGLPSIRNQWIRSPKVHCFETAFQSGLRPGPH